jgi:hypothetical protein
VTQGSCEILEVAHELRTEKVEILQIDLQELIQKIKEFEREKKVLQQAVSRACSRRKLIQSYARAAMNSPSATAPSLAANKSEGSPLNETINILDYHRQEMIQLDELETDLEEKLSTLSETITVLESDLRKTKNKNTKEKFEKTRAVSILVNVRSCSTLTAPPLLVDGTAARTEEGDVAAASIHLLLSYVVSHATWSPSYDLRVDTVRGVMDLTYFAEVIQQTGEDWSDCEVSLSTSNPAIGSSPPPLPTRTIDWSYNCSHDDPLLHGGRAGGSRGNKARNSVNFNSSSLNRRGSDENGSSDDDLESVSMIEEQLRPYETQIPTAPPLPHHSDLTVSGSDAGSTTFFIPRKVTIESDNKPHKVTVTNTSFTPQMVHYVSAALSPFVYLQAKTQNTSPYPLLPSDRVAVFLDGNFISTTSIKQTSSGEYFNVFLGVDPSVKVQYMPCRTVQQVKGWLTGHTEVKKYFYSTVVQNTKQRISIRMIIAEILPRSADEKIVVELLDPAPASLVKASSDTAPILSEQDVIAALDGFEGVSGGGTGGGGGDGGVAPSHRTTTAAATSWPRDFVTQNKFTNNIVWLKTLQPGEKAEVKFSYRVTWPQGQGVGIR